MEKAVLNIYKHIIQRCSFKIEFVYTLSRIYLYPAQSDVFCEFNLCSALNIPLHP